MQRSRLCDPILGQTRTVVLLAQNHHSLKPALEERHRQLEEVLHRRHPLPRPLEMSDRLVCPKSFSFDRIRLVQWMTDWNQN